MEIIKKHLAANSSFGSSKGDSSPSGKCNILDGIDHIMVDDVEIEDFGKYSSPIKGSPKVVAGSPKKNMSWSGVAASLGLAVSTEDVSQPSSFLSPSSFLTKITSWKGEVIPRYVSLLWFTVVELTQG